jgi:hypothetical protein
MKKLFARIAVSSNDKTRHPTTGLPSSTENRRHDRGGASPTSVSFSFGGSDPRGRFITRRLARGIQNGSNYDHDLVVVYRVDAR